MKPFPRRTAACTGPSPDRGPIQTRRRGQRCSTARRNDSASQRKRSFHLEQSWWWICGQASTISCPLQPESPPSRRCWTGMGRWSLIGSQPNHKPRQGRPRRDKNGPLCVWHRGPQPVEKPGLQFMRRPGFWREVCRAGYK